MDPAQKQAIMVAILAFNFTFIIFTIVFNSTLFGGHFVLLRVPLGLLIAAGAAAGGYFACKMTQ